MESQLGLITLWNQGDWVTKSVAVLLLGMSLASWIVILIKALDIFKFKSLAGRTESFWHSADFESGMTTLGNPVDNPFVQLARSGQEATAHHRHTQTQLHDALDISDWISRALRNSIDDSTGTIRARVRVAKPDAALVPGRYGHVDLVIGQRDNALLVDEKALLGAFRYSQNLTVLHTDAGLMPHRRRAWASWNYIGADDGLCVTYWMNRLQGLPGDDLFVTLNPPRPPRTDTILRSELYEHPIFDPPAIEAQKQLWSLQGQGGVWFCGAHFGAGFHEDGLQSGLAVAEQLGGVRRPWSVANESGRIHLTTPMGAQLERAA